MTYNLIALYRDINWGQRQAKVAFVFGIVFSICGLVVYCLPLVLHKDFSDPDLSCINIIKCSECNEFDRIPMIDKVVSDYMKTGIEEQRASTKEEADD